MGAKCCCCSTDADDQCSKNLKYQERRDATRVFKRVDKAIIGLDQDGHTCVNEYRIVSEICSHAHARVCVCEDRVLKALYVVKIARKVGSLSANEVSILKNLEHPNLVHLVEVIDDPMVSDRYLILELLEGGAIVTLDEHGRAESGRYAEDDAQRYMKQLISALDYLHGLNIVHGNIKPENILLTQDRTVCKLTDFQMSTAGLEHDTKKIRHPKERKHEVPWFRAPEEFVAGEVVAGRACDIWALGATLYVMLFGTVPFCGSSREEVAETVTSQALAFPDAPISRTLRMLLRRMLEKDLLIRITLNEILDDPWVTGEASWQGKPRERTQARSNPKTAPSQFELLKKAASKKKTGRIGGRHILVAEDVYLVRQLVVRMLKGVIDPDGEDISIDAVVDGDEAVQAVEEKNYALIFMDLHMSRMSGFQATLHIREFENSSGFEPCVIIGLTGDLHEEINEICLKVGMNEVATKPLRPNQARALFERYGFKVNWEKPLDAKSLSSDGRSNVFLKSYCRYLENHGEALQVADDRRAACIFLLLHSRRALPLYEPPTTRQECLRSIFDYLGCVDAGEPSLSEDDEDMIPAPAQVAIQQQELRRGLSLGELKTAITKRAESVRTGMDSYGKRYINEYTLLSQLGVGSYGTVFSVVNTFNQQIYALKSANKRQLTKCVGSFRIEVEILQSFNHPNIIKVFEIIDDPNSQEVYFVMEYIEGGSVATVDSAGKLNRRLSELEAKRLMIQCIAGLEYLHGHNVVHRDIKPDNILVDHISGMYKLSDFGVSHFLSSDADDAFKSLSGTPLFAAPETCSGAGQSYSGKAADIWALGITLYGLLYGQVPFEVQSQYQLFKDIQTKEIVFPEKPKVSSELRMLLGRMLEKDVLLRITGPEVRDHSWLTGKENLIRKVSREVREANKKKLTCVSQPALQPLDDDGPKNVLIVEDVFLVRELLKKMFLHALDVPKEGGSCYGIDSVADGDEAIQAYATKRYHLILMDVHMPKVSGFDATLRMREMEIDQGLPRAAIVGQTGDVHERINEVCMEVGMNEVVQKPLTPSLLQGICVRYGFAVKKNAPIPKDFFDKEHAFTSSFKQYIERCDPGFLQGRMPQSTSTMKFDRLPQPPRLEPVTNGSTQSIVRRRTGNEPKVTAGSAPSRGIEPLPLTPKSAAAISTAANTGMTHAAPAALRPLLRSQLAEAPRNASFVALEDIQCIAGAAEGEDPGKVVEGAHATDDLLVSDTTISELSPVGNGSNLHRPPKRHCTLELRSGLASVSPLTETPSHSPPRRGDDPLRSPPHAYRGAAAARSLPSGGPGGPPQVPYSGLEPHGNSGEQTPHTDACDTPGPREGSERIISPPPLTATGRLGGVSNAVDPRAYIWANKKPSHLKLLRPEEVLPVIQMILVSEAQKRHETISHFLTDEEICWIRDETLKLYNQCMEPDPQLHLAEGVEENQLRKKVQVALPDVLKSLGPPEPLRSCCAVYVAQECGKRDAQEDTFVCLNRVPRLYDWDQTGTPFITSLPELAFCAVYDGHGGRTASEYCRNQFHLFVLRALRDHPTLEAALPVAAACCNAMYSEKAEKANSNAGTTAAALFIQQDGNGATTLVMANLGDCRIVLCSETAAVDLTRDHKPHDEAEKQRIEALGGQVVFNSGAWRVNGVLTVSRALGSVRSCQKYVSCIPDVTTHKLKPEDQFIVIASDGLWNVMSSADVVRFVLEAKAEIDGAKESGGDEDMDEEDEGEENGGGMTYQLIAEGLVSHAIDELKSDDNVTVIIVFFDHEHSG